MNPHHLCAHLVKIPHHLHARAACACALTFLHLVKIPHHLRCMRAHLLNSYWLDS